MGRFYRTSTPQFVDDKMFELPYEFMGKIMQGKDKAVDDTLATGVSLFDKLHADVYTSDAERANQIILEKEQKINEITDQILRNPDDYMKFGAKLRGVSRDINETWTRGEIYEMEKNNKSIIGKIKDIQEKHKKDPEYATAEIEALKNSYAQGLGYDTVARKGKNTPALVETYGLEHTVDDFIKTKLTSNEWEKEQDVRGGNGYIIRDKHSGETVSPEQIAQAYQTYFNAHEDIKSAVGRRSELGMPAFQGADLENAVGFTDKGKLKSLGGDWYGKNIAAAIANMKYSKTKDSQTLHTDEPWMALQKHGWEEEEKKALEEPGWTYGQTYDVSANSAETFSTNLSKTNAGLMSSYQQILKAGGISPDSALGKQVLSGNSHAITAALSKAEPATAKKISREYSALKTQKNFLNAQAQGFQEYLLSKGYKNKKYIERPGWSKDPKTQALYNQYLQHSGTSVGKKNAPDSMVTFNGMGMTKETIDKAQKLVLQNFDDMSFNVDETVKGSYLTFEKEDGNKVIYMPRGSKVSGKTVTPTGLTQTVTEGKKKYTITYKTAPEGQLSVQSLIQDGLIQNIKKKNDDGEESFSYVTRENGKQVGLVPDEKTLGLSNSLDNGGKANYGMTMQIGSYRLPVLISSDKLKIPSVDKYIDENYDDLQFNNFMNKTNLTTLGRSVASIPGGKVMTEKGKAYIIDGKKVLEVTDPARKREIYKIVFAENN